MNPLLSAYLRSLATHPVRTKAFLQEVLASHLAGEPAARVAKDAPFLVHVLARANVDARALKMALYGFCVSAPLGHLLVGASQRAFAGRTGLLAKLGQVLAANLVVAPIQIFVFLTCSAVINGATTVDEVARTVRAGFMRVLRVTWMTLPLTVVVAQRFIPPELWVPFMNTVQFFTGTYFNTKLKKIRMEAEAKAKKDREEKGDSQ
ncbi:hypothetical protein BKA93DRAFT_737416 [Sparassis latifolia]